MDLGDPRTLLPSFDPHLLFSKETLAWSCMAGHIGETQAPFPGLLMSRHDPSGKKTYKGNMMKFTHNPKDHVKKTVNNLIKLYWPFKQTPEIWGCLAVSVLLRLKWMALEEGLDNFEGYMLQQAGDSNNDFEQVSQPRTFFACRFVCVGRVCGKMWRWYTMVTLRRVFEDLDLFTS